MEQFKSDISGKHYPIKERIKGSAIRKVIVQKIQETNPDFTESSSLALDELNEFR